MKTKDTIAALPDHFLLNGRPTDPRYDIYVDGSAIKTYVERLEAALRHYAAESKWFGHRKEQFDDSRGYTVAQSALNELDAQLTPDAKESIL